jgi:hypothetical protein
VHLLASRFRGNIAAATDVRAITTARPFNLAITTARLF